MPIKNLRSKMVFTFLKEISPIGWLVILLILFIIFMSSLIVGVGSYDSSGARPDIFDKPIAPYNK